MGIVFLILIISGVVTWVFFRENILNAAWNKAAGKLKIKGYSLSCESKGFEGLFTISLKQVSLTQKSDTLFVSQSAKAGIDIWNSIWKGPTLSMISVSDTRINLYKNSNGCNYCGLSSSKTKSEKSSEPIAQRIFNLLKKSLEKTPGNIEINHFKLTYSDSFETYGLEIPNLTYDKKDIEGSLKIAEGSVASGFSLKGNLDRKHITGKIRITPVSGSYAELPLIKKRFGIMAGFSEADMEIAELQMHGGILRIDALGKIKNAIVDDRRLADTSVIFRE